VPGRTKVQCRSRWHNSLASTNNNQARGRTGKWTADKDNLLKDAAQRHGSK
jgi:hypothetical protein